MLLLLLFQTLTVCSCECAMAASASAADVFAAFTTDSVPPSDVQRLTELQAEIHQSLRSANQELASFNALATEQHARLSGRFATHVTTLQTVHTGLLAIFKRVRNLRGQLLARHPELAEALERLEADREAALEADRAAAAAAQEGGTIDATELARESSRAASGAGSSLRDATQDTCSAADTDEQAAGTLQERDASDAASIGHLQDVPASSDVTPLLQGQPGAAENEPGSHRPGVQGADVIGIDAVDQGLGSCGLCGSADEGSARGDGDA